MLELTNAEESIMNCIWEQGKDVSVADLLESLEQKYQKKYARTTISVFMSFLRDKGYVSYHKKSHAYLYHPLVSRDSYRAQRLKELMERCFDDSLCELERCLFTVRQPAEEEKSEIITMITGTDTPR